MNKHNLSVVAVVLLLTTSSGCSGMKNFLFGRGAQCGLCNRITSPLGLPAPPTPYAPTADCGCNGHAAGDVCTDGASMGGYGVACPPQESYMGGYAPSMNDPYLGGDVVGSSVVPYEGQVYGGTVYGQGSAGPGTVYPEGYVPGPVNDNFDARGDRIMRADPLPSGAQLLP